LYIYSIEFCRLFQRFKTVCKQTCTLQYIRGKLHESTCPQTTRPLRYTSVYAVQGAESTQRCLDSRCLLCDYSRRRIEIIPTVRRSSSPSPHLRPRQCSLLLAARKFFMITEYTNVVGQRRPSAKAGPPYTGRAGR